MIRWLGQLPAEVLFPVFVLAGIGLTYVFDLLMRRFVKPETRQRATATAAVTLQVTATIYAILIAFVIVDEYTQLRDTQSQISDKASSLSIMYESSRALPEPAGNKVRVATLDYARSVVTSGLPAARTCGRARPAVGQGHRAHLPSCCPDHARRAPTTGGVRLDRPEPQRCRVDPSPAHQLGTGLAARPRCSGCSW